MEHLINVTLAGLTFSCALCFPEAAVFPAPDTSAPRTGTDPVCLSPDDWDYYCSRGSVPSPQAEFSLLTAPFSDALMDFDRLILHGVALRWRDRAWLICGVPGVGKSTQARFLQELRPGEFGVICGDRPILEFRQGLPPGGKVAPQGPDEGPSVPSSAPPVSPRHSERSEESASPVLGHSERSEESVPPVQTSPACRGTTVRGTVVDFNAVAAAEQPQLASTSRGPASRPVEGSILVHPSPWNGKENWHGADAAPLAGLILLQRGDENRLTALSPREAAIPTYAQVIQTCKDPEKIRKAADLITCLVNAVPIWQLTTHQVPASTHLLLESVFSCP